MRPRKSSFFCFCFHLLPERTKEEQKRDISECSSGTVTWRSRVLGIALPSKIFQSSNSNAYVKKNVLTESEIHAGLLMWEHREAAGRRTHSPNRNGLRDGEHSSLLRTLVYPSCVWNVFTDSPGNLMPSSVTIFMGYYSEYSLNRGSWVFMLFSMYLYTRSSLHI